jgi:hypothetical protein
LHDRKTHFNCSPGFNIDEFSWLDAINTQVAEQGNSILQRIRCDRGHVLSSLCRRAYAAFMTKPHFMEFLRFFCGTFNRLVDAKPKSPAQQEKLEQLNQLIRQLQELRDSLQ